MTSPLATNPTLGAAPLLALREPTRFERAVRATAAAATSLGLVDILLRWLARSASFDVRFTPFAVVVAVVMGGAAQRGAQSRTRARAVSWLLLGSASAAVAAVAALALDPRHGNLGDLFLGLAAAILLPVLVVVGSLPAALLGRGSAVRSSILLGAAGSLAIATTIDFAFAASPYVVGLVNPSITCAGTIGIYAVFHACLGTAALVAAAAFWKASSKGLYALVAVATVAELGAGGAVAMAAFSGGFRVIARIDRTTLWGVARADDGSVWIVGSAGTVLREKDGDVERITTGIPGVRDLFAVCTAGSTVWAVGDDGVLLRGEENGGAKKWSLETTGTHAALRAMSCGKAGPELIVGDQATILRRGYAPAWKPAPAPFTGNFLAVAAAGKVRWIAHYEGLLRSEDGGESWKSSGSALGARGLWSASDHEVWVAGSRIGSSTDQAPVALRFGISQPMLFSYYDDREPAGFGAIASVGAALCAVGDGIVCSTDGGRTFREERVRTTEPLHALSEDGRGGIVVVGEGGLVLQASGP